MATPIAGIEEINEGNNLKFDQHNNALRHLEALSIGAALSAAVLDPTSLTPTEGDLYIIAGIGAGDWLGFDNHVAQWETPGWNLYPPFIGSRVFNQETNSYWLHLATGWEDLGLTEKAIGLPYTLLPGDRNKELTIASGTGIFNIPDTADSTAGFEDYWECLLTLDGAGDITIQRTATGLATVITESGNSQLKTQGRTVKLRHRTSNNWKIDGVLEP